MTHIRESSGLKVTDWYYIVGFSSWWVYPLMRDQRLHEPPHVTYYYDLSYQTISTVK